MRRALIPLLAAAVISLWGGAGQSQADELEQGMFHDLRESRNLVAGAEASLKRSGSCSVEIKGLKKKAEELRAAHILLMERLKGRDETAADLGGKALDRQNAVAKGYAKALEEYLALIDAFPPDADISLSALEALRKTLNAIVPNRKLPIIGSLPYIKLKYPASEPNVNSPITPAYQGGNQTVTPEDTTGTTEAPITEEIAKLAKSLDFSPVLIYEWVKNNVDTEWYWGCMKGAEETLRQKTGNDCDQTTLLAALLKASGFPTRFVQGAVEFFPDIEKAKNLTGINDPAKLAAFFQRAGIPFKPVISGGKISNLQIEHVWVESLIPYSNYRGAVIDDFGKTWVALDTSIKPSGYSWNSPVDVTAELGLESVRDAYLQALQNQTPLEYVKAKAEEYLTQSRPGTKWQQLLRTKSINPQVLNILPASLQFRQVAVTGEYTSIPENLRHKLRFSASTDSGELFSITLDAFRLAGKKTIVSYEPETVEDQAIIDSYGGLDNTPPYLVRLRPVLKVNDERLVVAGDGLSMGAAYTLSMEVITPNGTEKTVSTQIAGNLAAIAVAAGKPADASAPEPSDDAGTLLFKEACRYIDRWSKGEDELAALLGLSISRPIPTIATVGNLVDVTYLLDVPHGFQWKGVFLDANLRGVEVVAGNGDSARERTFMRLSALEGSILENRIFEDDFQVQSVSTAKLMQLAATGATPVVTLDGTNIDTLLPGLPFDENVKSDITNAVRQEQIVRIPQSEIIHQDWSGIGYIKENPETGESGWMLSGMVAGGMSVLGINAWTNPLAMLIEQILQNPYSSPPNMDPQSAASISKISACDLQEGTAGKELPRALQVIVLDSEKKPVEGAEVTFFVKAGKGTFSDDEPFFTVKSDRRGIAIAPFTLGKKTSENAVYWLQEGNTYSTQIGQNIVSAKLASGLELSEPFIAYGFPDKPARSVKKAPQNLHPIPILSFAGSVVISVEDINGNPIANEPVTFTLKKIKPYYDPDDNPPAFPVECTSVIDPRPLQFVTNNACTNKSPIYGECDGKPAAQVITDSAGNAIVGVILGGTNSSYYVVSAVSEELPGIEIWFGSTMIGMCGGAFNDLSLNFQSVYPADTDGHNINAGKVGTSIPLQARIYFLREEIIIKEKQPVQCDDQTLLCPKVLGSKIFNSDTNFDSVSVSFGGQPGNDLGNGVFTADYSLKAGRNVIAVSGTATASYKVGSDCHSCTIDTKKFTDQGTFELEVYGVDVELPSDFTVTINGDGYVLEDTPLSYTITPSEYKANLAFVQVYEDDKPFTYMVSEKSGTGTVTIAKGLQFNLKSRYEVEVVLNYGTGVEIRSKRIPLYLAQIHGEQLGLVRTHILSQFDANLPVVPGYGYIDDYKVLTVPLARPSTVSVKILDQQFNEKGTLVPSTGLSAGDNNFVVDHEQVRTVLNRYMPQRFFLLADVSPDDGGAAYKILYPGKLVERTDGEMLGQTIVHDVLIQNGSLTLSRQDFSFSGRGPQLAFGRNYTNLSSSRGQKPLGEGWSHSLDLRMQLLSTSETNSGSVPDWVNSLKGKFFSPDAVPHNLQGWTKVRANGTTFRKHNGAWYSERGRHGRLVEAPDGFVYTAKDGTKYQYIVTTNFDPPVRSIEDKNGNKLTFDYEGDLLAKVTDAVGRFCSLHYKKLPGLPINENSRIMGLSCSDGIEVVFSYTPDGYLRSAKRGNRVEVYDYASEQQVVGSDYNLAAATDTNNRTFRYEYHKIGELPDKLALYTKINKPQDVIKSVTYPDSTSAQFTYDVQSENKRIVKDLRGKNTVYTLNFFGNPLKIEEPLGKTTLMTWSIDENKPDNVMTSRSDPRTFTTFYEYDAAGNVTKETDPYGKSIVTLWNQKYSLPESRTDRNGVLQTWQYDPQNGDLLQQSDGDRKTSVFTYYPTGEKKTALDPRGYTTTYTWDQYGNPASETGPEGSVTRYEHDIRGRRTALTDPNNRTTKYTYDSLDQPLTVVYPSHSSYTLADGSGNVKSTNYDPEGNLLSETDRTGLTLTYTYTPRDQVKTITRNVGGTKTFDYDGNGNLTSETDWKEVATTHHYDDLNRRDSTTNRLGHTTTLGYDLTGNITSETDAEGRVTTHEYDRLNRLTDTWQPSLDGQERGNIHYTYYDEADPKTNLKTETDQEENTTTYEYNGRYLRTKRLDARPGELQGIHLWEYDDNGNLWKETDEEGRVARNEYDKQNRLTATVRKLEGVEITTGYRYDPAGNRTHVIDANGNDTETVYDEWNRPWKLIDPDKYVSVTELDGEGREVKTIDGNLHQRTKQRDKRGLVLSAVDAENKETRFSYDLNGNVETLTDAKSVVTRTTYDAEDKKLLTIEVEGLPEERRSGVLLYDKVGNPLQVRDGNGNVRKTEYNALNLPAKAFDPPPFDANYAETTYYRTGKVKTVTDRRKNTTGYEYDELNRVVKVTDPLTKTMETTYDKVGNVRTIKDKREIVTETTYNELNLVKEKRRAGLRLVTNEYDGVGNLRFVTDAKGYRIENQYNKRNLPETTIYPATALYPETTEKNAYDGVGNLLTHTDEETKVTSYTYDNENRQRTVELAGETTEKRYDEVGNPIEVIKPEGNGRTMEYDGLKRLTSVTEGGLTTRYEYDANGNTRHQYDARNNDVEYTWDELNRKKEHIQHRGDGNLVTSFTYDEEGNLKKLIDPKGQEFTYDYDELNRRTDEYFPTTATPYLTLVKVKTDYDGNNNVTSISETKTTTAGGTVTDTTTNTHDNFDRLKTSATRGVTVTYDYDDNGNRTGVSTSSGTTTYTYYPKNWVKTAVADGKTTNFDYFPDGKKKTIAYPNGAGIAYTYFPTDRIKTVTNTGAGNTVISSFGYGYDRNGNRTSQVETRPAFNETTTYRYDTLDRMQSFTVASGSDTTTTDYTFDSYNRASESVRKNGSTVTYRSYNYDETDRLTNVQVSEAGVNKAINYTYDKNGNTVRKQDTTEAEVVLYDYDASNQMVRAMKGSTLLGLYDYNSDGLRIRHRNSERGDVDYWYDGRAVIEERKNGSLLAHYRYAGKLLSLLNGGEIQYYHFDALGSTANLTNSTGAQQAGYFLDPWGHVKGQEGESVNRQIFTGQEHDENTGLIYFGARYYDPDTARFITEDSYLGEPGTPPSLNRYLYAYSNPTVYVDLYGNAPVTEQVASFLHRLVNDEKKEVANLNRGMKDKGFWGQLGTRTTAAFMGIGGSLISVAAGTADMVDLSLDVQIANTPILKNTSIGKKSQKRVEEKVKTAVMTAKKVFDYVTTEDPKAMAQAAFKATTNYLDKTFIEGDLNYTADFSGKAFGVAMGAATMRAAQISKAAAVEQVAIRENVLANVIESQQARAGSGFAEASRKWKVRENVLANVSESQTARGTSGFAEASRKWTANDFYKQTGWSQRKINEHLRGIDFSKPVSVADLPAGSNVIQYQLPGGPVGNYFALPGTPANTLGIYTSGLIENSYITKSAVKSLKSSAASVVDDWSMKPFGWKIQTQGEGMQFFVPNGKSAVAP